MNLENLAAKPVQSVAIELILTDPNRRPLVPKKVDSLRESIEEIGLLQPLVVEVCSFGYNLLAGNHRLAAIQALQKPYRYGWETLENVVPIVLLRDLSPIDRLKIELHENTRREPLTWQQELELTSKIKKLLELDNPEKKVTREKLAEVSEVPKSTLDIQRIVEGLMDVPEVANAPTLKEAGKVALSLLEKELSAKLATTSLGSVHSFIEGCSIKTLATLPESLFRVCIIDPPYGVRADKFNAMGQHSYDDSPKAAMDFALQMREALWKVMKHDSHIYWFCDIRMFSEVKKLLENDGQGFHVWPKPLIWVKNEGSLPCPYYGPKYTYEAILFARKGNLTVNKLAPDTIIIPNDKDRVHPAQKPVDLYTELLARSYIPGCQVLDPCCGSGTIFKAADKMRVQATGIEQDPQWSKYCIEAIQTQTLEEGGLI